MKKIALFMLAFLIMPAMLFASDCPKAVKDAFKKAYPNVKKVKWSMEKAKDNARLHEAEFKVNGVEMSATYKEDGTLLETEMDVKRNDIPQKVLTAVAMEHPNAKPHEYAIITRASGAIVYEIEIREALLKKDLLYKADGTKAEEL